MSFPIRVATAGDLARLEGIENDADAVLIDRLKPDSWTPAPPAEDRMRRRGYVLVLAEQIDAAAVGFVHVLLLPGRAHLEQVSVLASQGRRGHGRALVEAAKREAVALGCELITLRTFAHVPWNAPFYASCGFIETDPGTPFEFALIQTEEKLGILGLGRRVQMVCHLR